MTSLINNFIVISGCSGGGKSTLLAERRKRGHATLEEPGRRIVKEELENNGSALTWKDEIAFIRRAVSMALADRVAVNETEDWVFFDRGLTDSPAGLQHLTGQSALEDYGRLHRYNSLFFTAHPWPEIYEHDSERRHSFDIEVAEYNRLLKAYALLDYKISTLPKVRIEERANFVLNALAAQNLMNVRRHQAGLPSCLT